MDEQKSILHKIERISSKIPLSLAVLIAIAVTIAVAQTMETRQQLHNLNHDMQTESRKRGDAALDMLESVHSQAMLNRKMVEDGDGAIETLNGTMEQFAKQSDDLKVWLVMGDKIMDFQKAQGSDEIEGPRDAVDRETLTTGNDQEVLEGTMLRMTRAVKLGQGTAADEKCGSCHSGLMGIEPGDVMGAYSAEIDMTPEIAQLQARKQQAIINALLYVFGVVAVLMAVLKLAALNPLGRITLAMKRLVAGEKDVAIPGTEHGNEIGEIARALAVFRDNAIEIERLKDEAAKSAEHQLHESEKQHAERQTILREVSDSFDAKVGEIVAQVATAASQLQTTAKRMVSSAEETDRKAEGMSSAALDAANGATNAAQASDAFAMSISEISQQAAKAAETARLAGQAARDADERVTALSNAAQSVDNIVTLISTVAQRTALLALNASIEAARSGEAGRGFAVVASEVKELASQTSKATDEIAAQIAAMQDTTHGSVEALKAIAEQVEALELASVSIAAAVDEQSAVGADLAHNIDRAAGGARDITENVGSVRASTLETGEAASQVLASSAQLDQQARELQGRVDELLKEIRVA